MRGKNTLWITCCVKKGRTKTSNMSYADTATHPLTIEWSRLHTFKSISLHTIGTECDPMQGNRDGEKKILDDKECSPPSVKASTLVTIH